MKARENHNVIIRNGIQQTVRKAAQRSTSDVFFDKLILEWMP